VTNSITIIGAGKVGSALAVAFFNAGVKVDAIISRSGRSAESLAKQVNSSWGTDINSDLVSDFIILTTPDKEIENAAGNLGNIKESILLHTAGSYGTNILASAECKGKGVLYPLQTFSPGREIDIRSVPLLIEGNNSLTEGAIFKLSGQISDSVFILNSADRKQAHLSAVFVCNFVNHLLFAGEKILQEASLPFSILDPLINETILKARENGPATSQTGPAVRNDESTIEKHIDLLSFSPEFKDIYKALTRSIIKNSESK
jgi:predicted short-subunit dehydrogenase-like oxidoreductase (DUF2520 family)